MTTEPDTDDPGDENSPVRILEIKSDREVFIPGLEAVFTFVAEGADEYEYLITGPENSVVEEGTLSGEETSASFIPAASGTYTFNFYPRKETNAQTGDYTYVWDPKNLDIAPGIMVTTPPGGAHTYPTVTMNGKTYYILETGHDYIIEEDTIENNYSFEFQAVPYHPMLVDGEMKNISLGNGTAEEIVDSNTNTSGQSLSTTFVFRGTNNLRSGLNIVKKLQDKNGADILVSDRTYYVRLYAKDKEGIDLTYTLPAQGTMSDEEYAQAKKDYDDAYPIWYKWFSSYTIDGSGNYQGATTEGVTGDGWSYSWASGDVKEIKPGELLQIINIPYGTQIKVVEVKPVYDTQDPTQIVGYEELDIGDKADEEFKLTSVTGDLPAQAGSNGYTTIGFDNSYEAVFTNKALHRQSSLVVEKKWLKADGTEYTDAEIAALNVAGTTITGELWRSYSDTSATSTTDPTVTIYAKSVRGKPQYGDYLASFTIEHGTNLVFAICPNNNSTTYPELVVSPSLSGEQNLTHTSVQTVTYTGAYSGTKTNGNNVFTLTNITQNTVIYANFGERDFEGNAVTKESIGDAASFGVYTSYQAGDGIANPSTPTGENIGSFTLSSSNNWRTEWTGIQLNEGEHVYTYELRNVMETTPSNFYFSGAPRHFDDGTGNEVFALDNVNIPETELVVRKVWGDGNANHSSGSVSYKIQRAEYDASGALVSGPADYDTTYTLNAPAWQSTRSGLPLTNGRLESDAAYRRYVYSVVETGVPTGYTVEYGVITEGGQAVNVIRNIPENEAVKIEKVWKDSDNSPLTSGIPEGAYITGTMGYDYTTYQGVTVTLTGRGMDNGVPHVISHTFHVQRNSTFIFWGLAGNRSGPITNASNQTVRVNGTILNWNSGWGRHNFQTAWSSTERAYVYQVYVTDDTTIDIDCGDRDIWDCDVESYTQAPSSSGSDTTTFRLDAENGWSWYWVGQQNSVYSNYTVTDIHEYLADHTDVTTTGYFGFEPPVVGALTEDPSTHKWSMTVTNKRLDNPGFVSVTKTFSGIDAAKIPANFKITAAWTEGGTGKTVELTTTGDQPANVMRTGSGLSYTWTIADLPLNTAVTFTETGYEAHGYVVATVPAQTIQPVRLKPQLSQRQPPAWQNLPIHTRIVPIR